MYTLEMMLSKITPYYLLERLLKIINLRYLRKIDISKKEICLSIINNYYIKKTNFTLSNYGVWMKNNFEDKTFKLSILSYRNKLEKILLKIAEPTIFIDIGANQGVFSLVAGKNKNFIQIHAFEPNINLIPYLQENLLFNKVDNFFIHKVAIGLKESIVNFSVSPNHSGSGRVSAESSEMKVVCVNRNYLNKVFIRTNVKYFVKIDVEGSEKEVLNELFNSKINLYIKYIFIEINSKFNDENSLIKILVDNGFFEKSRKGDSISFDALFERN
jgi:FkbM family methyltransferase